MLHYLGDCLGQYVVDDLKRRQSEYRKTEAAKALRRVAQRAYRKRQREEQAGRDIPNNCEICNNPPTRRLCFDHCHKTGKFRGFLCDRCNQVLGLIKDDPDLLQNMMGYLRAPA